jgi:hypothetical protein
MVLWRVILLNTMVDPTVLVHLFEDGRSYLVSDNDGNETFGPGSAISTPENLSVLGSGFSIRVVSIDTENQIATLSLSRTPSQLPQTFPKEGPFNTPWIKWSELITQGEALVILDGKALSIPRHSLLYGIVENIALYKQSGMHMLGPLQSAIRQEAISNIVALSNQELSRLRFLEPAKPLLRTCDIDHDVGDA